MLSLKILDQYDDRRTVRMTFTERGKQIVRDLEFDAAQEAAHAVAKIRYNRALLLENRRRFARPDDATVALALGQWCLKVAGVSFVERGLARAIFGGSPPTATFAEALAYFQRADKLRPAPKTKALIKLVQKKMK